MIFGKFGAERQIQQPSQLRRANHRRARDGLRIQDGSPNALVRHGFTKNTLPKGTEVIFEGFQAKDGANRANGRDIILPGGKKLNLGSSGNQGPPDDTKKDDTKKEDTSKQ